MPANTAVIPLKAIYTGSDVTSLGELNSGDKLDPQFLDLSDYITVANTTTLLATKEDTGTAVALAIALG
jgi:hypothetical protein